MNKMYVCAVILVLLFSTQAFAVVYPDRMFVVNPLAAKTTETGLQLLPMAGGWGDFSRYISSESDWEHHWGSRLGAAIDIVRYNDIFSFTIYSDIELIANPRSEITYNPRSFYWQETFQFNYKTDSMYMHAGYSHRCKHDVDNLEVLDNTGERKQLVLIYDSIYLRLVSENVRFAINPVVPIDSFFFMRWDYFVIKEDDRLYAADISLRNKINDLSFTWQVGLHSTLVTCKQLNVVLKAHYIFNVYTGATNSIKRNYYIETGIALRGREAEMTFFLAYEYQERTFINPYNERSRLLYAGLRIGDKRLYK